MSPAVPSPSHVKKISPPDNLYTVILALAFCAVFAAAVFVAYKCYAQYGTIFSVQ